MAYTPIVNGDTGGVARGIINGIGSNLDSHTGKSGSDVHNLGTIAKQSASSLTLTGDLNVSGSVIASGYINGEKSGVFAYLTTSASTAIAIGGTYYPISGSFANNPIYNFGLVATPAIKYINNSTQYFKIDFHGDFFTIGNGRTVDVAIKVSGSLIDTSIASAFAKTGGEHYPFSGLTVVELNPNDEIQLVTTCDAIETITFHHFAASISRFFS